MYPQIYPTIKWSQKVWGLQNWSAKFYLCNLIITGKKVKIVMVQTSDLGKAIKESWVSAKV